MTTDGIASHVRLVCTSCGHQALPGLAIACASCGGNYETSYDRATFDGMHRRDGANRFAGLLPIPRRAARVTLGEGDTPLIEAGGAWLKCEHLNPTGSYKDRIASVGISLAVASAAPGWVGTSSGNAGAAYAAYGARAGLPGTVFTNASIPDQKRAQIELFGTSIRRVRGLGEDPGAETALFQAVAARAAREGLALAITARTYNAAAMDGVKPIAFELVEELGRAPDAVFVPTGGGGLAATIWLGFLDLEAAGVIEELPRIVVAQPSGCAAIHAAILRGDDRVTPLVRCTSTISGLQLVAPPDGDHALGAVRASNGYSVAVEDADALAAQAHLAGTHGVLVEPAAALAYAAFRQRPARGVNVVVLTGSGMKTTLPLNDAAPPIGVDEIDTA
jgi:threonine synthase